MKAKTGRSLEFSLKGREAEVARREGGRYWLYLVYGIGTPSPVVLAVRNPLARLPLERSVREERREEYTFRV